MIHGHTLPLRRPIWQIRFFPLNNDLRLSIDLETQTPASNQQFISTIRVANDGPDDAVGIRVKVLLPDQFSIHGSETSAGPYAQEEGTWQIDEISSGAEVSLQLILQSPAKGAFALFAEIVEHKGQDPDSKPNNFDERLSGEPGEDDTDKAHVYIDC